MPERSIMTPQLVEKALEMIRGEVERIISTSEERTGKKRIAACVTVLFGNHLTLFRTYGDPNKESWPNPYDTFSLNKARLVERTGYPNHIILQDKPHLLKSGDFKYYGGDIEDDIIVATSGLAEFDDLRVSRYAIITIKSLCMQEIYDLKKNDQLFIQ